MAIMASDSVGSRLRAGGGRAAGLAQEFETFLLRGNVVDLAIGVVIGVAFNSVVTALVKDLITPLIAALGAQPDFATMSFNVHGARFRYGDFFDELITFFMIAVVVFFLVVKPMNRLVALADRFRKPAAPTTRECTECLSKIPLQARRCAYCTSPQIPVEAPAQA